MAVLLLATPGSCGMDPGTKNAPANSKSVNSEQNTVRDLKLREAWENKTKGLNKLSHDYPEEKFVALQSLLAQLPQQQVEGEFDKIARSPVGYADLDEYQKTFVQVLIMRKVNEQDRAALVALFSSKAPEFYGGAPIVIYLSYHLNIPDPLLVLFDSYERTTNANTKKDLLSILGHTFRKLREKLAGDDEFVLQSKQWYLQNHAKFELNPYYYPGAHFPDQVELFIDKSKRKPR